MAGTHSSVAAKTAMQIGSSRISWTLCLIITTLLVFIHSEVMPTHSYSITPWEHYTIKQKSSGPCSSICVQWCGESDQSSWSAAVTEQTLRCSAVLISETVEPKVIQPESYGVSIYPKGTDSQLPDVGHIGFPPYWINWKAYSFKLTQDVLSDLNSFSFIGHWS